MPAKDPRINFVVLSGKFVSAPEVKTFGEHTIVKAKFEATFSSKDKSTGNWENKTIPFTVKAWNKTGQKIADLQSDALVTVSGRFRCDHFEYQGQPRTQVYIEATEIGEIEWDNKKMPGAPQGQKPANNPDEPISEDDIPF